MANLVNIPRSSLHLVTNEPTPWTAYLELGVDAAAATGPGIAGSSSSSEEWTGWYTVSMFTAKWRSDADRCRNCAFQSFIRSRAGFRALTFKRSCLADYVLNRRHCDSCMTVLYFWWHYTLWKTMRLSDATSAISLALLAYLFPTVIAGSQLCNYCHWELFISLGYCSCPVPAACHSRCRTWFHMPGLVVARQEDRKYGQAFVCLLSEH